MTTQQFVDKARKVHGEQYDYRKTEYNYNCEKVSIICPVHGEFSQKPVIHLSGSGCQKCGRRNSTLDQYLVKAKAVHGDRYDYSASKYTGANNKITFICKVHGVFEQHAHHHLSGHQCPRCAHTESFLSAAEWLEKAAKIHGNTYDYSKVAYVNARSPVTIVCRKHGEFQQMSDGHLQGAGCPRCCHRVSKPSIEWLEAMKVLDKTHIQHGGNGGEVRVQGTLWHADGFSAELNKVYEFHGKQTMCILVVK